MNFGTKSNDSFKKQQPTYHVMPNFTTRPFPDGPFTLGTLVEDLKHCYPINQGAANRVPISEGQRYTDLKEDIKASLTSSTAGEVGLLVKVLDRSIGGDASLKGHKKDEDVYKIDKLETSYFYPDLRYIKKCLQLTDVKDYCEMSNDKAPVYLITGLKIVWGAVFSTEHGQSCRASAESGIQAPPAPINLQVMAQGVISSESEMVSSFGKPANFVLALQVQKIYHKRSLFGDNSTLAVKRVVKHAVLVDDESTVPETEDSDDGLDFILADLEEDDLQGSVFWTGANSKGVEETWISRSTAD